jgi:hypothetical protein
MDKDEQEAVKLHAVLEAVMDEENAVAHVQAMGRDPAAEARALGADPMRVIEECELFAYARPFVEYRFTPW